MPYIEWRNPDLAPKPDLNLPGSHKEAAWLRELIAGGHIPAGVVDERSTN